MRFALKDFAPVLATRDSEGRPFLLIGGQAVYKWANRYAAEEPGMEQWRPFTSKDIDFQGGRNEVIRLAKALGVRAHFPDKRLMTALVGVVPFNIGGEPTTAEFLWSMPGVKRALAEKLAVEHEAYGLRLRVLDPVSLLASKLYLALRVKQDERRDVEHMRIMVLCVRAFLRETLRGVETGDLPARGWLGAIERVLKLAEASRGLKAARDLEVDWIQALPLIEIAASTHRAAIQLREKRLPLWQTKLNRRLKTALAKPARQ
ncbi:MAG: hypothetical protein C5B50_06250 [Verrucomicrobia bacterium]|nr:MAG: hypothetical protein C5B50_06250 [Verrucomicrobiota bacterium]